jgi:hypothetical protein
MIYRLYWSRPFRKNPDLRDQMREPIIRMAIVCIGSICTLGYALPFFVIVTGADGEKKG